MAAKGNKGYAGVMEAWEERRRLAALLARDDAEGRAALATWRERTPSAEADDQLADVMEDISGGVTDDPGHSLTRFLLFAFFVIFPMLGSFLPGLLLVGLPLYLPLGVFYAVMFFRGTTRKRPARFRAAAILAESGDDRALPTLIDIWLSGLPGIRQREDKTEDAEAVLSALLLSITARADGGRELRYPTRACTALKRFLNGALALPPRSSDWSDRRTDALIAALLLLHRSATGRDWALLRRVAAMPGAGTNRDALREVAAVLLNPDSKPIVAPMSLTDAAAETMTVSQQVGGRIS